MKLHHIPIFLIAAFLTVACNSDPNSGYNNYFGSASNLGAAMNFQSLQQQILIPYCIQCHQSRLNGNAGFGIDSYQDVVNSGYVIPGNANASRVCTDVANGIMPRSGQLPAGAVQAICGWIANGAPQ